MGQKRDERLIPSRAFSRCRHRPLGGAHRSSLALCHRPSGTDLRPGASLLRRLQARRCPLATDVFHPAPRGGLRPVAFTKTHVNRALHPHQRSSDVLHVTPVPRVPMASGRTPGSAAHPSQATLQVDMSTAHATVRHTKAARHALSVPLPAAPAATCGSAASGLMSGSVQQPHHDEERRCMHLRHMTRAHKIIHHRMHGM